MERKKDIRNKYLAIRNKLTDEEVKNNSLKIALKVCDTSQFINSNTIFLYNSFRNEVSCKEIFRQALNKGKKTAFPKVFGEEMKFFYVNDENDFEIGTFGILEPKDNLLEVTNAEGLVIVPGVVFDMNGYRIGYGKGYYDRFLSINSKLNSIGIAHSVQIVNDIPRETHDIMLETVITEI